MSRWLSVLVLWLGWAGATQAQQPSATYQAEAFLGTWEWRSGTDVFRLVIRRDMNHVAPNGDVDHVLLGMHMYSRNGTIIENAATESGAVAHGGSFIGSPVNNTELLMFFVDISKHKTGKALLTIDPGAPDEIHLQVRPQESATIAIPNTPPPTPGYTFPTSMTLTRVP